jgi:hypothetical protein
VKRVSGRLRVRFRAKVIEMRSIGAVCHPGKMDLWRGRRVLYAPDMDRLLRNPVLHLNDMNPSLVAPLLRLRDVVSLLGTPMNRRGSDFSLFSGWIRTGTGGVSRGFPG